MKIIAKQLLQIIQNIIDITSTLLRFAIIKRTEPKMLVCMWRKENVSTLLLEMEVGAAIVENTMEGPQKTKTRITT